MIKYALYSVIILLSSQSFAQFSMPVSFGYEQQAEKQKDGSQAKGLGLQIIPKYSLNEFSGSAKLSYNYDLNQPETGNDWDDGVFTLSTSKLKLFKAVKTTPSFIVELPFSKESRENRGINYVVNASMNLALDSAYLELGGFNASYSLSYGHFQNDYTTRLNGEPATKYKIAQAFNTSYSIHDFTFGFNFQFLSTYSYEDIVRNGFMHIETISYQLNPKLSFSLYHYNKGSLYKAKTYENNLKSYDPEKSTIGLSTDLMF
ncbi:MAG: hypothetical protein ACK4VO_02890 [Pseudobdellovibrio sp.]